jgi:microcystin degradation protein MlrC
MIHDWLGKVLERTLGDRPPEGGRPLRIAYGRLFHEANAYSPRLTTRADFERMHHLEGEALAEATTLGSPELKAFMPHAELTGFMQAMRRAGGVEAIPLTSSLAVPGGPVARADFESLLGGLCARLRAAGRVDGIYLALHGSMQVDGLRGAPEAEILDRVREVLGPDARIAASFDLHGNLTDRVVRALDVLVAYRTNPHWDLAPTGYRAGTRLLRVLRGGARPTHAWRKLPMVLGGGTTIDFLSPMRPVFRAMRALETRRGAMSASLFMVHPYTTAEPRGWAVHVATDGDPALAEQLADELADRAWAERDVPLPPMRGVDEALDEVAASRWRKLGPITLVDVDDIVGAGAPGGNTRIAAGVIQKQRGLSVYVPLHDPALVAELWDAPIGSRRATVARGTPGYDVPEIALDARIAARATTDHGRSVRLDAGDLRLVATESPPLPIHPSFWSAFDLDARRADAIVQKNFFHYRMFYATTSFHHIPVVSAGATSLERVRRLDYPVPMHPRDRIADWRSIEPRLRAMSAKDEG